MAERDLVTVATAAARTGYAETRIAPLFDKGSWAASHRTAISN